ncbi:MAG TPA: RNA-binding transcriptional accessory protein, partial [Gammaproteobacteria bacterium]|nr:RNA-binding transcriptional accessory protein [Gammaproteobacteria bacterium]
RALESRLSYLRELETRRISILKQIEAQGQLSDELKQKISAVVTKTELEDLYLPFKKKRRTKAQMAREAGLEPLARQLFEDLSLEPAAVAAGFVDPDKGVESAEAALEGARQILMEQFTEDAVLLSDLRERLWSEGILSASVVKGKAEEGAKFSDYFDYREEIHKIPSHRALALFRGRNEGILSLGLDIEYEEAGLHPFEGLIAHHFGLRFEQGAGDDWMRQTVAWTWKIKLHSKLDVELKLRLRELAEAGAIDVFGRNLGDLLLAAPAGPRACMGLDPGIRTGVKVAVVDQTGKLLDTATIYPHAPKHQWDQSIETLAKLAVKHQVSLVSIGNGTASRETDKLTAELMTRHAELKLQKIMVSEAGASVYSASELAAQEFPELDVSLRGAVSIARRLQDPLAELVKIDPKSIGVGQYQHDVNQAALGRKLNAVVEDCVNAVGVDVNMASVPLLTSVSGLSRTIAENIVQYRDTEGAFKSRVQLKKVPRLGAKTYEQAAGFLRVMNGDNLLDQSAVHPEAYTVVNKILGEVDTSITALIGDVALLKQLDPAKFTDEKFGLPTVKDILSELEKPGRDPRPEFKTATFREGVEKLSDLKEGMRLEGVVTNVTNFGAFVDIGVHQDGLVHISQLADQFVKNPHDVVSAGDVVTVKVVSVDLARKRVGLTMRSGQSSATGTAAQRAPANRQAARRDRKVAVEPSTNNAMAQAFARAKK